MGISELAVLLAGFALAHAAWSISDVPRDELLTPLAFLQNANGERQLLRFASETQAEAIAAGTDTTRKLIGSATVWALAREGLVAIEGPKVDVLAIDLWGPGMDRPITVLQQFSPAWGAAGFRVIGEPRIVIDGHLQPTASVAGLVSLIHDGIREHAHAGTLWDTWQTH